MADHLVSVLTPVYNGESYISRLLDSILAQTYPHIEMILVDDGSDDSTVEIANSYISKFESKGYSLTIISRPHKNASAAISAGLPYINGRYLVWPDSDDELLPDSIAVRVNFLETHPAYHCVRSLMEYVSDETGAPMGQREPLGDLKNEYLFWDVLEQRSFNCCGCYMLETDYFFQIYPEKKIPESEIGQNYQMLLPFLFQYKCPTIEQKLYRVHVRPDSHSRQEISESDRNIRLRSSAQLIDEIMRICSIKNKSSLLRAELMKLIYRKRAARQYNHHITEMKYRVAIQWFRIKLYFYQAWEWVRSGGKKEE